MSAKKHVAVFCIFLYTAALLCGCGTGAEKPEQEAGQHHGISEAAMPQL